MTKRLDEKYVCILTGRKEEMTNGKMARIVRCWCGKAMKLGGLGGHLHYAHNQKRDEVTVR